MLLTTDRGAIPALGAEKHDDLVDALVNLVLDVIGDVVEARRVCTMSDRYFVSPD